MKKWECTVCGYIHTGETPPDECPMCAADKSKFVEVTEETTGSIDQKMAEKTEVDQEQAVIETGPLDTIADLILKNHLHPITVHSPNGIVPVAVIFLVLAMFLQLASFELASFYNLVFVLLALPPVLFSGYIEWSRRYKGARTSVFITKLTCGAIVLATLTVLVAWRIIDPEVASSSSSSRWIYFLVHLVLLGAVGLAGHLGGKLAFAGRKR